MPRFVFPLEAVLRQRKHVEQERLRELAACQAEMTRLQAELKGLNDTMQSSAADMKANHLTGSLDVGYLAAHRRFTLAMQRKGLALVQDMARQQRKVDDAQRLFAEAAKERKVIEKLREKQFERWKQDVERKEQADADEVGAQFGYRQVREQVVQDEGDYRFAGDAAAWLASSRSDSIASAKTQAMSEAFRRTGDEPQAEEHRS